MFGDSFAPEPFEVSLQTYLYTVMSMSVFPFRVPQSVLTYPRIVYSFISAQHDTVLSGPDGVVTCVIQFDVYSTSLPDALVVAEQLRQNLQGFSGIMGSTRIQNVNLSEIPGDWTPQEGGSDKGTYRKSAEYEFTYENVVPSF